MKKFLTFLIFLFLSIGVLFAQHLKKDGTPYRRYKENRTTYITPATPSSPGTHLKKDGTPDMRYKENKATSTHLLQDGTPDKRYRVNNAKYNYPVERDKNGKIKRNRAAAREFMKQTGYPHGRPGYVIDHIIPLKEGGCDCPENMQWQTIEESKAKDKWE
jgi:hypothetical protein